VCTVTGSPAKVVKIGKGKIGKGKIGKGTTSVMP